jgi:hypothetical protein
MLSNRNCFKLLVKMITASPIARCPSFKFLTMQMQPSASWARDCGPFCPRPPCSQTSRTASTDELARSDFLCFDDLASGYRTRGWVTRAAGYRAAISCVGTFRTSQPESGMSALGGRAEVVIASPGFRPNSGHGDSQRLAAPELSIHPSRA